MLARGFEQQKDYKGDGSHMATTIWVIWKTRNNKIFNNEVKR